jgi:uncharacterized protein
MLLMVANFSAAYAQNKNTDKKASVSTEKGAKSKPTQNKEDIPPEMVQLEDSKIDVVPNDPQINFDTSAAPDDAFTKTIHKLLEVTGALQNDVRVAEQAFIASSGNADSPQIREFKKRFLLEMKEGRARTWLTNLYIRSYRKFYTEEDVKALIEFYQTPLGKKVTQTLAPLMQAVMTDSQKIGAYLGRKLMNEMMDKQ